MMLNYKTIHIKLTVIQIKEVDILKKVKALILSDTIWIDDMEITNQLKALSDYEQWYYVYQIIDDNILVKLNGDIDLDDSGIKEAVNLGVNIKEMYFVIQENNNDKDLPNNLLSYLENNLCGRFYPMEYLNKQGMLFESKEDAQKYEDLLSSPKKIVGAMDRSLVESEWDQIPF